MDAMPVLQMSLALEPRYKKLKCVSREQRDAMWDNVSTVLEDCCNRNQQKGQLGVQPDDSSDEALEPKNQEAETDRATHQI